MTFGQAIRTCFAKYADGTGRATRSEFWYFYLFYVIVWATVSVLQALMVDVFDMFGIFALGWELVLIAFLIPLIAVGVRRMHDIDKSGWFVLIPIYALVLLATPGTVGPNSFGPSAVHLENGAQSTSDEQALRGYQTESTSQDLSASYVRPKKHANLVLIGLIMLGVSPLVAFGPFILAGIGSQLFCEGGAAAANEANCGWAALPWLMIMTIPTGFLLAIGGIVVMIVGAVRKL